LMVLLFNIVLWLIILRFEYVRAHRSASGSGWFTRSRSTALVLSFATSIVAVVTNLVPFTAG